MIVSHERARTVFFNNSMLLFDSNCSVLHVILSSFMRVIEGDLLCH